MLDPMQPVHGRVENVLLPSAIELLVSRTQPVTEVVEILWLISRERERERETHTQVEL
jgi:hypothetical protein